MNINLNNISKIELKKIYTFLLVINKVNYNIKSVNISKENNLWFIKINEAEFKDYDLDKVIEIILNDYYVLYNKLLITSMSNFEMQEYVEYHAKKKSK